VETREQLTFLIYVVAQYSARKERCPSGDICQELLSRHTRKFAHDERLILQISRKAGRGVEINLVAL
jgi:hypothetical protein